MDRIASAQPMTREQLLADLRADLEAGAAAAEKREEPLWRWLMELADAEKAIPLLAGRTSIAEMSRRMGLSRNVTSRFRTTADEWIPRFAAAFGDPHAGISAYDPNGGPEIDPVRAMELEELATEIEAEMAKAPHRLHAPHRWLASLARRDGSLAVYGERPNLRGIAKQMGVVYSKTLDWKEVFERWAPRFTGTAVLSIERRDRLSETGPIGTALPVKALIAGLELDLRRETEPDSQAMLRRLLAIAREDRIVPRGHAAPHFTALLRSAGIDRPMQNTSAMRVLNDWLAFFELDDQVTRIRPDGTIERQRRVAYEVAMHIAELRGDGTHMIPLEMSTYPNPGIIA